MAFNVGAPTFGTATTSASPFSFGSASTTTKPATGFGTNSFSFGSAASSSAPTFNLGSSATTTASNFGGFGSTFGAQQAAPNPTPSFGFGQTNTSTAPNWGGLGQPATTTASTGFGFTGFGTPTTQASTGFGGFGTQTSTPQVGFGFGSAATTTVAATPTGFSGFGTPSVPNPSTGFSFAGFGTNTQPASNIGFGGFGAKPFGTTTTTQSTGLGIGSGLNFGQTQQPQQQQVSGGASDPVYNSVFNCCMFGDERDEVLAKWNLLQACWGSGKGYYSPNMPPVEYTPQNPFCRFKAIAYSKKPRAENKEGLVALMFNKKAEEIQNQQTSFLNTISTLLGNKPNLSPQIHHIRPVSDATTQVVFCVEEKGPSGQPKKIPNSDLVQFFLQPGPKQQLVTMGVTDAYPFVSLDKEMEQFHIDNPPPGIDQQMWKQAHADNPDSEKLIPVPMYGFSDVRWRYLCQQEETKRHQAFLDTIATKITSLQQENEAARLKIAEFRRKFVDLEHRVLKVLVMQQITKNIGVSLRPEEEQLRSQLDAIKSQLNSPQFRGRLNDLLTQIRLHKQEASQQPTDSYTMTTEMQDEIRQFLEMQQAGIKALVDIMGSDFDDLKTLEEDLAKMMSEEEGGGKGPLRFPTTTIPRSNPLFVNKSLLQ